MTKDKEIDIQDKKIEIAAVRAAQLMLEHGLGDWKIKLNRKRTTLAETCYTDKSIRFSKHFVLVSEKEQFDGVTLHEITHALLGRGYGHGKEFEELCIKIGASGEYAQKSVEIAVWKYNYRCLKCGYEGGMNVKKKRFCYSCFDRDVISVLKVTENKVKVKLW